MQVRFLLSSVGEKFESSNQIFIMGIEWQSLVTPGSGALHSFYLPPPPSSTYNVIRKYVSTVLFLTGTFQIGNVFRKASARYFVFQGGNFSEEFGHVYSR